MKVYNLKSSKGNRVPNQLEIKIPGPNVWPDGTRTGSGVIFQSYQTLIAFQEYTGKTYLDKTYWDYSRTTSKYRNIFLGETTAETKKKIASGEYILCDLNGGSHHA